MTADLEAVTRTLADVIDAAMRAVNDPGQFCERGRNANGYVDTLNMWQRRALALALPPVLASIPDDRLAPVGNRDGVASWLQMAVGDRGPALADGLFEAGRILPDDRLAEAEARLRALPDELDGRLHGYTANAHRPAKWLAGYSAAVSDCAEEVRDVLSGPTSPLRTTVASPAYSNRDSTSRGASEPGDRTSVNALTAHSTASDSVIRDTMPDQGDR